MFRDRRDAGRQLAKRLQEYKGREGVLVLALPRGGVVVGYEISRRLALPLDVLIVKKIGFPQQPEFGIGAVSETGTVFVSEPIVSSYGVGRDYIDREIAKLKQEIEGKTVMYRGGGRLSGLSGRTVILVDDGVATGATVRAAIATLREEKLKKLVVALPVAPPDTAEELRPMADQLVCIETPAYFRSVGEHYEDFDQVSDEEVTRMLSVARLSRQHHPSERHTV